MDDIVGAIGGGAANRSWAFISNAVLLLFLAGQLANAQNAAKLAIDATRPIVYIEFDHAGPREPVEEGEPHRGLWLRLVNNSVVPITVRASDAATNDKITILGDVITPVMRPIPKSGPPAQQHMSAGYSPYLGALLTIKPGEALVFSVPVNHVSPYWYLQVPFSFSLPKVKRGTQPTGLAPFTWEDIPPEVRH